MCFVSRFKTSLCLSYVLMFALHCPHASLLIPEFLSIVVFSFEFSREVAVFLHDFTLQFIEIGEFLNIILVISFDIFFHHIIYISFYFTCFV